MVSIDACIELLKQEFQKEEMITQVDEFLKRASYSPKWLLYSDYCLDDKDKPNNVLSFALIPFVSEEKYKEIEQKIKETQPVDIKHSRSISGEFMAYIKTQAVFSFSFIVNDRQLLFGSDEKERVGTVEKILNDLKTAFIRWRDNADNDQQRDGYKDSISKINKQLREIFLKKKVKDQIDVLLITILAAYYTASILKRLPDIQIFGWFPDRDKTNEIGEGLAVPIFNALQYEYMGAKQYQFCVAKPDSQTVPFYDDENRIVDVICGTLADYNMELNLVSKDKFDEVLQGLMADNVFVKVYRFFVEGDKTHMGTIEIMSKKPSK